MTELLRSIGLYASIAICFHNETRKTMKLHSFAVHYGGELSAHLSMLIIYLPIYIVPASFNLLVASSN